MHQIHKTCVFSAAITSTGLRDGLSEPEGPEKPEGSDGLERLAGPIEPAWPIEPAELEEPDASEPVLPVRLGSSGCCRSYRPSDILWGSFYL